MAFEPLLNQQATEPELFKRLATFVHSEYQDLRRYPGYFLKFERVSEGLSQFSYGMAFNNNEEYDDFKWSSEYNRCGVVIFCEKSYFDLIGFGYLYSFRASVFRDRIDIETSHRYEKPNFEFEKIKRPPRELVEAARREFGMYAQIAKSKKGAA